MAARTLLARGGRRVDVAGDSSDGKAWGGM